MRREEGSAAERKQKRTAPLELVAKMDELFDLAEEFKYPIFTMTYHGGSQMIRSIGLPAEAWVGLAFSYVREEIDTLENKFGKFSNEHGDMLKVLDLLADLVGE